MNFYLYFVVIISIAVLYYDLVPYTTRQYSHEMFMKGIEKTYELIK